MSNRWQILKDSQEQDPTESLNAAASCGNIEFVQWYIANGADVNMRSPDGWTPLIECAKGDPEITRMLLAAGANPNLSSEKLYTPLMRAAGFGNLSVVKLLTEAGADLFARDDQGQTALDMTNGANSPETSAFIRMAMNQASLQKQDIPPQSGKNPQEERSISCPPQDTAEAYTLHSGYSSGANSVDGTGSVAIVSQKPRSVSIFLSSTFRDMHAERNYLRDIIFPELAEQLEKRGIQLEAIDLRLGVPTVSITEEQEKSLYVLKVCLAEVKRSRPFFLCMLGERYGWILPDRDLSNAAREVDKLKVVGQISVTELEIAFGLETEPGARRGMVFLRDPLPIDKLLADNQMSPDEAARYSDQYGGAERLTAYNKLQELKLRLTTRHPQIVRSYSAKWDSQSRQLTGLEEWGKQVKEILWKELQEETSEWAQQEVLWQVDEKTTLYRHWESHRTQFSGRDRELSELMAFAQDNGSSQWATLISSGEGFGKSALIAILCDQLEHCGIIVLSHCVGLTHRSLSIEAMQRRFVYELARRINITVDLPDFCSLDKVTTTFWSLLRQAGVTNRVVLLIDNIDQFRREYNPRLDTTAAGWLTSNWPGNVRLITSAREGPTAQSLLDRAGVAGITLGDLDIPARARLVKAVCDRYHRNLGETVNNELVIRTRTDGTAASSNPLWLTLATEAINLLDADDFQRTETEFTGPADERIEQLMQHTVRSLPTDIDGLYLWTLQRARVLHGQALADGFVKLTAISRYGLRELDYRALLPSLTNQPWDSLRFAMLRRTLRVLVQRREDDARCNFANQGICDLILRKYLPETADKQRMHSRIAAYLYSLPPTDPMRQQETMHHLVNERDALSSAKYMCECSDESEKPGGDTTAGIAAIYILAENIRNHRESFVDWIMSWLKLEELSVKQRTMLAGLFGQALDHLLIDSVDLSLRRRMHESIRQHLLLIVTDKTNADAARQLVGSHSFIGSVLLSEGNSEQAFAEFKEGERLARELVILHPDRIDTKHNLAHLTLNLGKMQFDRGLPVQAKPYFEELVQLCREIVNLEPKDKNTEFLASSLARLGHVCYNLHLTAEAKVHLQEAWDSIRGLAGARHRQLIGDISEHLGNVANMEGHTNEAMGYYQDVVSERETELASTPDSRQAHFRLSIAYKNLGGSYNKTKEYDQSIKMYLKAMDLMKKMINVDPANTLWKKESAILHARLGRVCLDQNRYEDAINQLNESVYIFEKLLTLDPGNAQWLGDMLDALVSIGDTHVKQSHVNQAADVFTRCVHVAEARQAFAPDDPTAKRELAVAHAKVGIAYMLLDDNMRARAAYEKAVSVAEEVRQLMPSDRQLLFDCAGNLWNLATVCHKLSDARAAERCLRFCVDRFREIQSRGYPITGMHKQIWDILTKSM